MFETKMERKYLRVKKGTWTEGAFPATVTETQVLSLLCVPFSAVALLCLLNQLKM